MPRVYVSTFPFCVKSSLPMEMMEQAGFDVVVNNTGKKHTEEEMLGILPEYDAVVAGTETLSKEVINAAKSLKFISRVGIGLDSVCLESCKENGVSVAYTPDAPAPAVAELTVGLILSLLRRIHISNDEMHHHKRWTRHLGKRISEITIGIVGAGRIGGRVIRRLSAFGTLNLLVNDIAPSKELDRSHKIKWVGREELFRQSDLISLHVPLTPSTRDMICKKELSLMKSDAMLINTSRGGIVNEDDLFEHLLVSPEFQAALDVFEYEPYKGRLTELKNCLLTAHMGSMSEDCRTRMEIDACKEVVCFFNGEPVSKPVPESEYQIQKEFK